MTLAYSPKCIPNTVTLLTIIRKSEMGFMLHPILSHFYLLVFSPLVTRLSHYMCTNANCGQCSKGFRLWNGPPNHDLDITICAAYGLDIFVIAKEQSLLKDGPKLASHSLQRNCCAILPLTLWNTNPKCRCYSSAGLAILWNKLSMLAVVQTGNLIKNIS